MLRASLPLFAACLLSLSSCSSSTDTKTATTDTAGGANTAGTSATDSSASSSAAAPAAGDSSSAMASQAPAGSGKADPNGPTAPHADDKQFMMSAAHSDQNEIQQSKMALAKGVTGMAKEMANKMIADHTKSTADLKQIASKQGVTLPTDMDAEHKAMAPAMEKLSGKAFEQKYISQMVIDHQKTANTMAAHQKMTKDPALQGFITKTLPVVESHLQMATNDANMKM
jgi:putative membrane protein